MNRYRRHLVAALGLAPLAPYAALAQTSFQFSELKPAQPIETAGKIEVIEFFWYGCPHCYSLEPSIETWQKHLAADTQFRRVPAIFNARWGYDAAIYYAFEAMGVLEKVHRPLFDAIHRDRLRTDNPQAMSEWLQKQGIDTTKFTDTFKSFGVQAK